MQIVAEIVNLNKFKKTHNRERKEHQAKINRAKFGQTKVKKAHTKFEAQREDKELTGKQLNNDDPEIE